MSEKLNPVVTPAVLPLKRRDLEPGLGADETNVSRQLGLTHLGASYFEVKPGEAAFPFHVHYLEDEMIVILEGQGAYRFGSETYEVKQGDVLSAPAGRAEMAHQLINSGSVPLKYICISSASETNVVELPEKGVLRVSSRKPGGPERIELKKPAEASA